MPIKKAAKKYVRVTKRKTEKNRKVKGIVKSAIKQTKEAIAKADGAKATEYLKKAIKAIDKAAEKKVFHKNTAARKKARLNKAVKSLILKK